ncbi:MAG: tetratricopeptide repeat protein [Nitrospinae bacterium]|nr:tetratricopeptide repeat protein [Nitrospinota bacterium]
MKITDRKAAGKSALAGVAGAVLCLLAVLDLLFPFSICWAEEGGALGQIAKANAYYQEKRYSEAARIYSDLEAKGHENGHLYYNLGNAYFRLGEIGPAILSYLKAKSLIPRDKDLEANLKTAIQETNDRLEEKPQGFMKTVLFWLDDFNRAETVQILIVSNFLFWLAMAGRLFFRHAFWDVARKTFLIGLCLAVISTAGKFSVESGPGLGVVFAKTADVKSSPAGGSVTLFQLHEGVPLAIAGEKDGWYRIELSEDKKGWIQKEFVGT